MKGNIKSRVVELLAHLEGHVDEPMSIRQFCLKNDINYNALYNTFNSDRMSLGMADKFKTAVPNLNLNWFLYGEGPILTH